MPKQISLIEKYFIVKEDNGLSESMEKAYEEILSDHDVTDKPDLQIITSKDCLKLDITTLSKKIIFLLDDFESVCYEHLKPSKALILGPRCIISCYMNNRSVPLGKSPVFTSAMQDLVISTSGMSIDNKRQIEQLVLWMGGFYVDDLSTSVSHLVASIVTSKKYESAKITGIKVMHPDWVKDVWNRSKNENILGTHQEFDKHFLPIFYGLQVCSTGLDVSVKKNIQSLVELNKGTFSSSFKSSTTDILILNRGQENSEKYKVAIQRKKDCLTPDWIIDSVKTGYALPVEKYKVLSNLKVSTPNKIAPTSSDFDCSNISVISHFGKSSDHTINETMSSNDSIRSVSKSKTAKPVPEYKVVLDKLNVSTAKKAGQFFDGCSIFLTGFTVEEKEKLNKILNFGGATRYDELNEKVTHIIIGQPNLEETKTIKDKQTDALLMNIEWLQESIKMKQPVNEEQHIFNFKKNTIQTPVPEPPSPASKRNIQSMNNSHTFKKPIIQKLNFDQEAVILKENVQPPQIDNSESIVAQYLTANTSNFAVNNPEQQQQQQPQNPVLIEPEEQCPEDAEIGGETGFAANDIFKDKTICVYGFDPEKHEVVLNDCEECSANLVDFKYSTDFDYLLCPFTLDDEIPVCNAKKIVNEGWLDACIGQEEIVEIEYYHEPVIIKKQCLQGDTIVISTYSECERSFIKNVSVGLGAKSSDTFNKKDRPILICPSPQGSKFIAAVRWNLAAVTAGWIRECARQSKKIDFTDHLINTKYKESQNDSSSKISYCSTPVSSKIISKTVSVEAAVNDEEETNLVSDLDPKNVDMVTPINKPRNKRISEITGGNSTAVQSPIENKSNTSTPDTPFSPYFQLAPNSPMPSPLPPAGLNLSDFVLDFPTPHRQTIYKVLKPFELSPKSKRLKELMATPNPNGVVYEEIPTPKTPECLKFPTSPWARDSASPNTHRRFKRKLEMLDCKKPEYIKKPKPQQTPLRDIGKMLFRHILGDDYVSSGDDNTPNKKSKRDDSIFKQPDNQEPCSSSTMIPNTHVRQFSDFIQNQTRESKEYKISEPDDCDTIAFKLDSELVGSESVMVGWRDPSEAVEERSRGDKSKVDGIRKFLFSSGIEGKDNLIKMIENLNGGLCESMVLYDESCTHYLCDVPRRAEKTYCAIAGGKWVLKPDYIQDSSEAGYFLDEELYEFGNPKMLKPINLTPSEEECANAAYKWRCKINQQIGLRKGAFNTFIAIIHVSEAKLEQFSRFIRAGGGEILNVVEPFADSDEAMSATICINEPKRRTLLNSDHRALAEAGVLVVSMIYLNDFILTDTPTRKHVLKY